jgi:hypothetical protein
MVLNNIMSDKSYMKEYLSFELFDFIVVPSPAYAYSNIKVNNKDWGLYLAVEVIAEDFIERQFGSVDGNLYKPESMDMGGGNKDGNGGPPDGKAFKGGGMPFGPGNDEAGNRIITGYKHREIKIESKRRLMVESRRLIRLWLRSAGTFLIIRTNKTMSQISAETKAICRILEDLEVEGHVAVQILNIRMILRQAIAQ